MTVKRISQAQLAARIKTRAVRARIESAPIPCASGCAAMRPDDGSADVCVTRSEDAPMDPDRPGKRVHHHITKTAKTQARVMKRVGWVAAGMAGEEAADIFGEEDI